MGAAATVVGVDGWRGGWVAVVLAGGLVEAVLARSEIAELAADLSGAAVIGVDMPIGLPQTPPRACDEAARRLLGPRRSSVFPAPPRDVLEAPSYRAARELSTSRYGRSVSAQSYALRHRILEVDAVARHDDRLHEVHPELAFAAMDGGPMIASKKTWNGLHQRRRALRDAGIVLPERVDEPAAAVPPHDLLDAAAVAWSALRIAQGRAVRLPDDGEEEPFGMAIWY